ncbi:MAG: hypothetical protein M3Q49_16955, partial [Actinomycetota bacterium]|nr:hypothetical protein [Actinomycetota bacterium]
MVLERHGVDPDANTAPLTVVIEARPCGWMCSTSARRGRWLRAWASWLAPDTHPALVSTIPLSAIGLTRQVVLVLAWAEILAKTRKREA